MLSRQQVSSAYGVLLRVYRNTEHDIGHAGHARRHRAGVHYLRLRRLHLHVLHLLHLHVLHLRDLLHVLHLHVLHLHVLHLHLLHLAAHVLTGHHHPGTGSCSLVRPSILHGEHQPCISGKKRGKLCRARHSRFASVTPQKRNQKTQTACSRVGRANEEAQCLTFFQRCEGGA
jgi:hypothetical protein